MYQRRVHFTVRLVASETYLHCILSHGTSHFSSLPMTRRLERHKRFARGRQGLMAKESGGPILDRGAAGNSQRYRKFVTPVQAFSLAGDALFWRVFLLSSREMCPRTNHQQLFRYHAGISIAGPGWRSEVPREGRRRARWRKDLTQRPDR